MPSVEWRERPLQKLIDRGTLTYAEGYAEPGYDLGDGLRVWFADWNPKKFIRREERDAFLTLPRKEQNEIRGMARIAEFIEKAKLGEIQWEDEWTTCGGCRKAYRISADSYSWQPSYIQLKYDQLCLDCFFADDSLVEEYFETTKGISASDDRFQEKLEEFGYVKLEQEFENGWYGGQDDSPENLHAAFKNAGITHVLILDRVRQFDIDFSVWVKKKQVKKAEKLIRNNVHKAKEDPARVMQRGLQNASKAMGELHGEGVKVAKIGADGNVTARVVSNEDFIAGKALD